MNWKALAVASLAVLAIPGLASAQDANLETEFTVDTVMPDDPFGEIDVTAAMGADADIGGWAGALNADQRNELAARCDVIIANQANYEADAVTFCTGYSTWHTANPVAQ